MALLEQVRSHASVNYVKFVDDHAISILIGDSVLLSGHSEIEERNETFQIQAYRSSWFAIGDDSGGYAFRMCLGGSDSVFRCSHGSIGSLDPEIVSDSFDA